VLGSGEVAESRDVLSALDLPTGESVPVVRRSFLGEGGEGPRVVIVAGVRGDTPEGTRVAIGVARLLQPRLARMRGRVDVIPCANPLAAHLGVRAVPGFDVDLSRRFPGRADGHAPDAVAAALVAAMADATQVIELRGAHPAFREEPQAHVRADQPVACERAAAANVRVVWKRTPPASDAGTLMACVPGLISLEGGVGNRLTEGVGIELVDGVLNVLVTLGILPEDDLPYHWAAIQRPVVADDGRVVRVRAERAGLFLPSMAPWAEVPRDEILGEVVDPVTGDVRETVTAPVAGRLLALREQPVVYPGTLVARVVADPA
jgi:predicted deacylase